MIKYLELWRELLETNSFELNRAKTEYIECKLSTRRYISEN